jgi:hypothetical protein
MKNRHVAVLLAAVLLVGSLVQASVRDLTEIVPAGTPMVVYVADVPASIGSWEASPLAELWNDPQVRAFFAPLRNELEIDRWDELVRAETGHSLEELTAMLTGDLVFFVEDFDLSLAEGAEDADFKLALAVAVGDNAAEIERMILAQERKVAEDATEDSDASPSEVRHETREYRGIELHVEQVYEEDALTLETGWAVVEGVWAVATPLESLERAVAAILDGGLESTVRSGANFETVSKHIRNADSWFFMDIEPWIPSVRAIIDEGARAAAEAGSPFPVDSAALIDALGIDSMQAVFATFGFADRTMVMDFGATYTEDKGLIKLLAYGPGEAPRAGYIPVDSDSFTTGVFDFTDAWSALVGIVNGINPSLMSLASMQLESSLQQAGVELDLKRDLLDNLTGEVASIQNLGGISGETLIDIQLEQDQVIIAGIRQREALENVIEGLKTIFGQGSDFFAQREFDNHTVFTLEMPQAEGEDPGDDIAYVVTDEYLLVSIGSPATLEKVLLKMKSDGESVWKQPKVSRAVGLLPDGPSAIQYQDVSATGDLVFHGIALVDGFGSNGGEEDVRICDPEAIPDRGTVGRYIESAVNGVWTTGRELLVRVFVLPAGKK